jgi:hypothetical protein
VSTGTSPVAVPLARAAAARDVDRLRAHGDVTRHGWKVEYDGGVLVTVTLAAQAPGYAVNRSDPYVITLDCDSYDTWPPEVKFVNPETLRYVVGEDESWLPRIEGFPNFGLHARYQGFAGAPTRVDQLVCFSLTRGYYDSNHVPEPHQRWTPGRHWLYSTIRVLHRALQSGYYRGRIG